MRPTANGAQAFLRLLRLPALLALGVVVAACEPLTAAPPEASAALPSCEWAEVDRVVDGDTIIVRIDGDRERLRYTGVDAPESVAPDQPVEPFGKEASARNRALVEDGWVCLERDISNRDRFDRLLRYVWLEDGRMVNEILLREGMANVVTFRPDVKYHDTRLIPAQDAARAARLGIWSE